jgi:hypothetical protein
MWNKLIPEAEVKIVLIADHVPKKFSKFSRNIILFEPIANVRSEFISQYIRSLYPCILDFSNGILITDIDMMPMNRAYYVNNIEEIPNSKFVYYRDVLLDIKEIAMCYNVATPEIWSNIFGIKNLEDIKIYLKNTYSKIQYDGLHGGAGWNTDQLDLYSQVINWNAKTGNFVFLEDRITGYSRLDRIAMPVMSKELKIFIKNGGYSDFHALRPYSSYKSENDEICNLVLEKKLKVSITHIFTKFYKKILTMLKTIT